MNALVKISTVFEKYMALIALAVAALSLFLPRSTLWIQTAWINPLLMLVMFGMGLALKPKDFALVFTRPRDILTGCAAQFLVMPTLAFVLSRLFHLDPALTAGVVLVGSCPGGTASNVMTYFARGDVALSVGMTSVNTLLAPVLTPAITYFLLRTTVNVDVCSMFLAIVKVIVLPIALGLVLNTLFKNLSQKLIKSLPMISSLAICMIIASVVSHNAAKIWTSGMTVFFVVMLHNLLGYACGFGLGKVLKIDIPKTKALSLEVGMQNSGLATSLANAEFSQLAMATVPGALFSVWHNISGAILASAYRKWGKIQPCDTLPLNW